MRSLIDLRRTTTVGAWAFSSGRAALGTATTTSMARSDNQRPRMDLLLEWEERKTLVPEAGHTAPGRGIALLSKEVPSMLLQSVAARQFSRLSRKTMRAARNSG